MSDILNRFSKSLAYLADEENPSVKGDAEDLSIDVLNGETVMVAYVDHQWFIALYGQGGDIKDAVDVDASHLAKLRDWLNLNVRG
jgi:hypothetical protein